ncbi:MAG: radical SAM family heme chaperone HemW [Candidatus Magnetobacterium sp. LHC-1]|uniref:Heme chaperone HemW n=1 Tax=Candidatus Magnetobacterium casense TaxID=1455061 RepID=A0ABS6RWV0_9BACT|nr:radical SAM family heme chaperone HemW [Candidatus Magnetobacterium casensis]MBF0608701.1 radical SAM family heme chaperone HemW [Nitrospirota bacterium]MBV6340825.1 radical SAM family heme chaperone HemW [Candidatus Magnetobacterium casensis]
METALYIHIPFCLRKCGYCDFYSIVLDTGVAGQYVEALKVELLLRRSELGPLRSIFIGGGTPTALEGECLAGLVAFIREHFELTTDAEITTEANPLTIDPQKLALLKDAGINRLSVGVQSFDDAILKTLGRLHDGNQARRAIETVAKVFSNYSVDLIYAVPGQSTDSWHSTLVETVACAPSHVSAYELTLEPSVPLASAGLTLPPEDVGIEMFDLTAGYLTANGYIHYEISNYARPGYQCLHNLNYWRAGGYVGVGAGAHSYAGGRRFSNIASVNDYIRAISGGTLPVEGVIEITPPLAQQETILLGLRTIEGVRAVMNPIIDELQGQGLVNFNDGILRLTHRGMLLSNRVIAQVIADLG